MCTFYPHDLLIRKRPGALRLLPAAAVQVWPILSEKTYLLFTSRRFALTKRDKLNQEEIFRERWQDRYVDKEDQHNELDN